MLFVEIIKLVYDKLRIYKDIPLEKSKKMNNENHKFIFTKNIQKEGFVWD
jgi:hypothetical protein